MQPRIAEGYLPSRQLHRLAGVILASMHFDRHMRKSRNTVEPLHIGARRLRAVGHHRRDQAGMAGPEPPQMQVAHPVAVDLQPLADMTGEMAVISASGWRSTATG